MVVKSRSAALADRGGKNSNEIEGRFFPKKSAMSLFWSIRFSGAARPKYFHFPEKPPARRVVKSLDTPNPSGSLLAPKNIVS